MLAIGRGLMSEPKMLLIDEPSLGLSPLLAQQVLDLIVEINRQGTTILLVEQNARKSLSIADYAYVLQNGKLVNEGTGKELLNNPAIQEAYLGGKTVGIVGTGRIGRELAARVKGFMRFAGGFAPAAPGQCGLNFPYWRPY